MKTRWAVLAALGLACASVWPSLAQAHCDTLDGPVVSAARQALASGQVQPALAWVRKSDEAEIRAAFEKARQVRQSGAAARELADTYFFETLVRVHRIGEGASYSGLKPAGTVEVPVAAADQAIASARLPSLVQVINERIEQGLHRHFEQVMASKAHDANNVEAGRAYAKAYVDFVHYAERLYNAAQTLAPEAAPPSKSHSH